MGAQPRRAADAGSCRGRCFSLLLSVRATRNSAPMSAWVDVEVSETPRVLEVAREPVLSPGEDGAFDDSGVSIGCIVQLDGRLSPLLHGMESGRALALAQRHWSCAGAQRCKARSNVSRRDRFSTARRKIPTRCRTLACFGSARRTGGCGTAPISRPPSATRYEPRHQARPVARRHSLDAGRRHRRRFCEQSEYALARPSVVKIGEKLLMGFACRGEQLPHRRRHEQRWRQLDAARRGDGPWSFERTAGTAR